MKCSRLIATDALARGIDVRNVDFVVLYDAPKFAKNYIHRIGRTGRAGRKGTSLVLVTLEEVKSYLFLGWGLTWHVFNELFLFSRRESNLAERRI